MLEIDWLRDRTIVNLRGDASSAVFARSVEALAGVSLPLRAGSSLHGPQARSVWAGPDDWFLIGAQEPAALVGALRQALAGTHAAVTDVSSGYAVLRLGGPAAQDILAQGCPIDLHERAFAADAAAGSHFFKAGVWLWRGACADSFELLVRSSFMGYVQTMLERAAAVSGAAWTPRGPRP